MEGEEELEERSDALIEAENERESKKQGGEKKARGEQRVSYVASGREQRVRHGET